MDEATVANFVGYTAAEPASILSVNLTHYSSKLWQCYIYVFSIYTLSDLGVLSNLIGSLSLANEHYSPPTE